MQTTEKDSNVSLSPAGLCRRDEIRDAVVSASGRRRTTRRAVRTGLAAAASLGILYFGVSRPWVEEVAAPRDVVTIDRIAVRSAEPLGRPPAVTAPDLGALSKPPVVEVLDDDAFLAMLDEPEWAAALEKAGFQPVVVESEAGLRLFAGRPRRSIASSR